MPSRYIISSQIETQLHTQGPHGQILVYPINDISSPTQVIRPAVQGSYMDPQR